MTRLDLQPSPLDRLDPVARAVRWWTSQILDIIGARRRKALMAHDIPTTTKRLPRHVAIGLPEEDGFMAELSLAKGNADVHRQALGLKLPDIAPIPADQLCVTARAVARGEDGSITYAVAMARRARLDDIEAITRKRGARSVVFHIPGSEDLDILSPATVRRQRRALVLDVGLVAALAVAAIAASMAWTWRIACETEILAEQERNLRGAAVAAEIARDESDVARSLIERGILDRRSTVALETIAALNEATPPQARWTQFVWTPDEITIGAEAGDATAAINALSSSANGWSIELAGVIAAAPEGGAQAFSVVARQRKVRSP
jgi:hypothetical protein